MSASAVFILDSKGRVLISRNYRGDIPMSSAARFASFLLTADEATLLPVIHDEGVSYINVKHNNLYCQSKKQKKSNTHSTFPHTN
jgi:AP-1 complex subunit mu